MNPTQEIQVQNLDHLGLVAGIIDEIGLVEQINQLVGQQPGEIVSPGHVDKLETIKTYVINAALKQAMGEKTSVTGLADGAKNCWSVLLSLQPPCHVKAHIRSCKFER